jgi:hypothetical protein
MSGVCARARFAVVAILLMLFLDAACRPQRSVRIGWDAPAVLPHHYRILVDGQMVTELAPPPYDESCKCLHEDVPVPPGRHALRVEACDASNACSPSAQLMTDP